MDIEKQKRRQTLRVVISESCMVLAVIATVLVLAFIVSGYWLNSDFKVERQGLLQISSVPTGAYIEIDGSSPSWLQRTNTSKMLPVGEHQVTLTKEGYDSWSKTINISEGLLYRVHYPRLFLLDREVEEMLDVTNFNFATVSPDHESILLADETTNWTFINLNSDNLEPKTLSVATLFSSVSLAEDATIGLFTGEILSFDWSANSEKLLLKVSTDTGFEWVVLDPKNVKNSINLTRTFGINFQDVEILDNSANSLLAVEGGNLRKIDVSGRSLSAILVENIQSFDHYESEIIFSALNTKKENYVGLLKLSDNKATNILTTDSSARVLMSKFYDDKYLTILEGLNLTIYKKDELKEIYSVTLNFESEELKVGHNGEFILMYSGNHIAVVDMESLTLTDWIAEGENFAFLDNDMIYSVKDGELLAYDYDGLNRRSLAKNVSSRFPALIVNDKWLYYFSDGQLIREWLVAR